METDYTTLNDLSVLNTTEEFSLFNKLNFCNTSGGRETLYQNFLRPLQTIEDITGVQDTVRFIGAHRANWPVQITNGSIMMIDKFYHATIDEIPSHPSQAGVLSYRLFSSADFSFVKFSTEHAFDFIKGMQQLLSLLLHSNTPLPLKQLLYKARALLDKPMFVETIRHAKAKELPTGQQLRLAHYLRYRFKQQMQELLAIYFQLDAWYSMAKAAEVYQLHYPQFIANSQPSIKISGLYHLLLQQPVAYDVAMNEGKNFLFLTGANMAGKSTFIKSVGAAVFLAHLGMGVPTKSMELTVFDGLLSNINVADNLVKGESYFFNEVQRIKATVEKISNGKKWLILIDELFKGTNVLDAMKCSTAVIEGLLHIPSSIFVLSTHLYEIGEPLRRYSNVLFKYFETRAVDGQLEFSYQLQDGISNDRLGYVILKREGVVDMLLKLKQ